MPEKGLCLRSERVQPDPFSVEPITREASPQPSSGYDRGGFESGCMLRQTPGEPQSRIEDRDSGDEVVLDGGTLPLSAPRIRTFGKKSRKFFCFK